MDETISEIEVVEDDITGSDEIVAPWYVGDDEGNSSTLNDINNEAEEEEVLPVVPDSEEDVIASEMEVAEELEDIARTILDGDNAESFKAAVSTMPEEIVSEMRANPKMLQAVSIDVESGLFDLISPHLEKQMAQGKSFPDAYMTTFNALKIKHERKVKADEKKVLLASEPQTNNQIQSKAIDDMDNDEFRDYFDKL